jgi:hypothetical protein
MKKYPNSVTEQTCKNTDKGVDLHSVESVDDLIDDFNEE